MANLNGIQADQTGVLAESKAQGTATNSIKEQSWINVAILISVKYQIKAKSFFGCQNLREVILPAKQFNDGAPEDKYRIENLAFNGCPNLKIVELPSATTSAV